MPFYARLFTVIWFLACELLSVYVFAHYFGDDRSGPDGDDWFLAAFAGTMVAAGVATPSYLALWWLFTGTGP